MSEIYKGTCLGKGRVTVPICRGADGQFKKASATYKARVTGRKIPKKSVKKSKAEKPKYNWKKACKPNTMWKNNRGVCYCRTRGGGVKTIPRGPKCTKVRRRKAPPA